MMERDTLYFDGTCPLCQAEITQLSKLSKGSLDLVDVHDLELPADDAAVMLKLLHLTSASGETLTGLDANVAAWQHTSWGFLFRPLRWPVVRQIADRIYSDWGSPPVQPSLSERRSGKTQPCKQVRRNDQHRNACPASGYRPTSRRGPMPGTPRLTTITRRISAPGIWGTSKVCAPSCLPC